jgi:short-subunit dehydrogenase
VSLVSGNVLLTGATGGIGGAIARAFAARGASLTLTGRRADVLEPLAAEVGGRAFACDLGVRSEVDRLVAAAGHVDVLVANAAMAGTGDIIELSQETIDRMLEVNLRAPIALARALSPAMIARGRGHLVFISSLNGKAVTPVTAMYSATKFGLRGFALGIRQDLGPRGVGVSLVAPGFVRDAGMFADTGIKLPRHVGTRTPEQVAAAVIRAVERNRAEVDVAPGLVRAGTMFAQLAPELAATVSKRMGNDRIAAEFAAAQADKIAGDGASAED